MFHQPAQTEFERGVRFINLIQILFELLEHPLRGCLSARRHGQDFAQNLV
jgi:hypothetical protein